MTGFDVDEGDTNESSSGRARTRPWQLEAGVMYFDRAILFEAGVAVGRAYCLLSSNF